MFISDINDIQYYMYENRSTVVINELVHLKGQCYEIEIPKTLK